MLHATCVNTIYNHESKKTFIRLDCNDLETHLRFVSSLLIRSHLKAKRQIFKEQVTTCSLVCSLVVFQVLISERRHDGRRDSQTSAGICQRLARINEFIADYRLLSLFISLSTAKRRVSLDQKLSSPTAEHSACGVSSTSQKPVPPSKLHSKQTST